MRNEDASQAGLNQSATVDARDDADHLAANEYGPAVGNTITGAGTITGATGTDSPLGANAHIVAVQGAGGSDTSFEDGKLVVEGQYGTLTIDADGNYSYARHPGTPAGVSDVFTYTLADDAGASDLAKLIINIGDVPMLQAEGSQTIQTANGVVVLPAGVELSDVRVVGRDLVVTLPDGSTMVIPDGAIFVPQLVIDGVEVPASNLAALLIGSEPKPAAGDLAGSQQSSGGNFEVPVAPLDPGVPLGDLLPPTELHYTPPEFEEIGQFIKKDTQPLAGVVSVQLDDDDIPGKGGNPGGVGDDEGSPNAVASGFLPGSEGDGALTWNFLATGAPAGFTYNLLGDGTLQVLQQQGGSNVVVLSISINHSTGAFTATEVNPIWHAPGADENNVQFAINYTVTDSDGDIAAGVLNIDVDDDTPTASGSGEFSAALVVDESPVGQDEGGDHDPNGVRSASANFAGAFSGGSFGADGPLGGTVADGTSYTLILSSQGASSGLYALDSSDTVADSDGIGQGQEILLYSNGGVIEGRVGGSSGTLYFTISVSSTGTVTFTQIDGANVWHSNTGSDDDTSSLSAAPGTILLQQTLTDADNDSASSNFDLSDDVFQIEDDGPTQPTLNGEFSGSLVVDESPVGADEGGDNAPAGVRSASGDFSGAFGAVTLGSFGTDGPLGGTVADGTSYALDLSSEGIASGLYALGVGGAQGAAIELYTALDGSIEGRVGGAMGTLYFTISVDSTGVVTFTQEDGANVWHSNTGSDDDTSYLNIDVEDGSLHLVQTLTDADGDKDSNSFDLSNGVFKVEDDGPSQPSLTSEFAQTVVVDESPLGQDEGGDFDPAGGRTASASFAGAFGVVTAGSFGTDGPLGGTVASGTSYALALSSEGAASGLYALDPSDTTVADMDGIGQGAQIQLYTNGSTIEGRVGATVYFTISVSSTGVVTFTQAAGVNIWHANTGSDDDTSTLSAAANTVKLVQTLTDADGDKDSNSFDLSNGVFKVEDDGPSQPSLTSEFAQTVVVDESPLGQDEGGDFDPAGGRTASASFAGAFGVVTAGSFGTDGPLGGTVASGTSYALALSSEGAASGLYALDPSDTTVADMDGIGQGAQIQLYTNGSTIEGRVGATVYFTISVSSTGVVTFTQAAGVNIWHANTGSDDDTSTLSAAANTVKLVQTLTDADGDKDSNSFDLSNGVFKVEDDGPSQPSLTSEFAQTVVVDESPLGQDEGGDFDPAGGRTASASFAGAFGVVTAGSFGTDGPLGGTVASGTSYALALSSEGAASGLYALDPSDTTVADMDGIGQGAQIQLYTNGSTIEGRVGATVYFTISVSSTGVVTFTQAAGVNIWHANTGSDDDTSTLSAAANTVKLVQTLTDADGDKDSNSFDLSNGVFKVEDDGPSQPSLTSEFAQTVVVDESPLGQDEGGDFDPAGGRTASASFAGAFGVVTAGSFGTDGPLGGTVASGTSYALALSSEGAASGLYALDPSDTTVADMDGIGQGAQIQLYTNGSTIEGRVGATVYFTISVSSTGVVTFTQAAGVNIWHANTGSDDDTSTLSAAANTVKLVQTLTDADGDKDSNSFDLSNGVFKVEDDGPSKPSLTSEFAQTVVVDESPLGQDEGGDFDPAGGRTASASFAGAFGVVTAGSFGTDGPLGGTVASGTSYALALSSEGAASGLYALDPSDTTVADMDGIGQGAQIQLYTNGSTIEGRVGATVYFTISVSSTGVVTFTQAAGVNIWHANTGSDDDTSTLSAAANTVKLVQTLTDADGDKDSNSFDLSNGVFKVEDDGPSQPSLTSEFAQTVVVDESPLGQDEGGDFDPAGGRTASASFAGAFGVVTAGSFGTDGPLGGTVASGTSYALALSSEGAASGLYALDPSDTTVADMDGIGQGAQIQLYTNGSTIEGRVGATVYFTISVSSTGVVTFTQAAGVNIWHANTGSDDDTSTLSAAANTVKLVQTLTDADGDKDSNSFDLSNGVFKVEDDGPSQPSLTSEFAQTVVVDESPLGQDEGGDFDPAGGRTASASFAGAFGVVTAGSFGTDGPLGGTVASGTSYALALSSEGAASGLYALDPSDTTVADMDGIGQGAQIQLYTNGSTIEGRVGATVYFTISVSSTGVVTFTQAAGVNIWHANTGSDDDTSTLSAAANTVKLVQTLTDADGDKDSNSFDLSNGVFKVEDDGPSKPSLTSEFAQTVVVDESPLGQDEGGDFDPAGGRTASASFAGAFGVVTAGSFGTDGPLGGTVASGTSYALALSSEGAASGLYALDPSDTTVADMDGIGQGAQIQLYTNGSTIEGRVGATVYFTISVSSTGVVTFTQAAGVNIWHANTGSDDDTSTLSAAANTVKLVQTLTDADGDKDSNSFDLSNGVFKVEDDGPSKPSLTSEFAQTVVVDESPLGQDEGGDFDPAGGRTASASFAGAFGVVTAGSFGTDGPLGGTVASGTSYALALSSEGAASGLYALDPSDTTVADMDGIGQGAQIQLYTNGSTIEGRVGATVYFTISVSSTGVVTFTQAAGVNIWHANTGSDDDTSTLSAAANTVKLVQTLTDADGDKDSNSFDLSNGVFKVEDDGPSQPSLTSEFAQTVVVDESPLGQDEGGDFDPAGGRTASASFAGAFGVVTAGSFGTDGPLGGTVASGTSYALALSSEGAASGLYALDPSDTTVADMDGIGQGAQIQLYTNGSTIEGRVGATVYFTISVSSTGVVTFTQAAGVNIWHANTGSDDDTSTLSAAANTVKLVQTLTDADGDKDSNSFDLSNGVFKVEDDGPSAVVSITGVGVVHDETPGVQSGTGENDVASLATAFTVSNAGDDPDVAGNVIGYARSTNSVFGGASSYGTDGAGSTVISLDVSSTGVFSGLQTTEGTNIYLFNESGVIVGRIGADPLAAATGQAAFAVRLNASNQLEMVQFLSIKHTNTSSLDETAYIADGAIVAKVTVTDADGDVSVDTKPFNGSIGFQDDGPTAVKAAAITTGLINGTGSASANLDGGVGGNGIVNDNFGADGGKVIFTAATISALTANHYKHAGTELSYLISPDGQTLTGYIDTTVNGVVDPGETVFTIQLQTGVGGNNYTITMNQTIDTTTTVNYTDAAFDFIGGNKGWFGIVPNGQTPGDNPGPQDDDSHDLLITPTNNTSINTSGILGGVDTGQSVGAGEGFRIDYVVDLTGTPPNDFTNGDASGVVLNSGDPLSEANHWYTNGAFVTMRQSTGSNVKFTAYNDTDNDQIVGDGTVDEITKIVISYTNSSGTVFTSGDLNRVDLLTHTTTLNGVTFTYKFNNDGTVEVYNVQGATGANANPATTVAIFTDTNAGFVPSLADPTGYDSLEVSNIGSVMVNGQTVTSDEFKFAGFGAVTTAASPLDLTVPISIVDGDGDVVSSGNLLIHANAASPPIVLDLNGDGVHFLGQDSGIAYDYGAGLVATAWAAPDDGILVFDANGNGTVDGASEFVFGGNGLTDMEALHAMYGDQLDATDADFTMFALWQDANSNGIVDAGEMMSLAEAGIESISLVSDGVSYSAANGDVYVAGTATFTRTDGSTGDAADSLFSTGLVSTTQEVERIAANSNTTVLAAALAAAGLASSVPAAAATAELGNASDANALDVTIGAASAGGTVDTGSATSAASLVGAIVEAVAVTAPASASAFDPGVTANAGDLITAAVLDGGVSELAQGTDAPASQMAIPTVAAVVAMPSADALAAMADGQAQHSGVVEKVLAEALDGGHSDQVDALLNALPANENGANPSLAIVASGGDVDVPTWHMGMDAGFTASMDHGISIEATMLHHDAIQPVVNG